MQFFQKAVNSVKQIQQAVTNFAEQAGLTPISFKRPQDEFMYSFKEACKIIDELAEREDADSSNADNDLYESKVRFHFKTVLSLLIMESEKWSKEFNDSVDDDISEMPCFDIFLHNRICEEMVKRGVRDFPRGTLPLILGTMASLIRSVKYPLLPHQSVHKHLSRLITFASRFDALHYSVNTSSTDSKQELLSYKKRVDTGLTALIGVLWRRIADNPPVLDFFTLYDTRLQPQQSVVAIGTASSSAPTSSSLVQMQMDILTALIQLMGKPKVGAHAKEALIVALSMRDTRVEQFILVHTKLLANIVSELGKKFQVALEQMFYSNFLSGGNSPSPSPLKFQTHQPQVTPRGTTPRISSSSSSKATVASSLLSVLNSPALALTPQQQQQNQQAILASSTARPVEVKPPQLSTLSAFIRALRLCDAVAEASFTPSVSADIGDSGDAVIGIISQHHHRDYGQSPLTHALLTEFHAHFLLTLVKPALQSSGEQQTLAANALLRRLLAELSIHSLDGPLLRATTSFLCCNTNVSFSTTSANNNNSSNEGPNALSLQTQQQTATDLGDVLLSHCHSLSRAVSESSLQLLGQILAVASLQHSLALIDKISSITSGSSTTTSSSSVINKLSAACLSSSSVVTANAPVIAASVEEVTFRELVDTLRTQIQTSNSHDGGGKRSASTSAVDERFCKVATHLAFVAISTADSSTVRDKGVAGLFDPVDSISGRPTRIDPAYVRSAMGVLLARLAGRVNELISVVSHHHHSQLTAGNIGSSGALLELIMSKLAVFQSLTMEEQLAVAALVYRFFCVVGTMAVVAVHEHQKPIVDDNCSNSSRLDLLLLVWLTIEDLWRSMRAHVLSLNDGVSKYHSMRSLMLRGGAMDSSGMDSSRLERDSQAVRQMLRTAVVTREMLGECRGCLLAVHQLRLNFATLIATNTTLDATSVTSGGVASSAISAGVSECESLELLSEEIEDIVACDKLFARYGVELGPLAGAGGGSGTSLVAAPQRVNTTIQQPPLALVKSGDGDDVSAVDTVLGDQENSLTSTAAAAAVKEDKDVALFTAEYETISSHIDNISSLLILEEEQQRLRQQQIEVMME